MKDKPRLWDRVEKLEITKPDKHNKLDNLKWDLTKLIANAQDITITDVTIKGKKVKRIDVYENNPSQEQRGR